MTEIARRSFLKGMMGAGAAVTTLSGTASGADPWPNRPVKIIMPWPAGGVSDTAGRIVADSVQGALGQPVIVENRPGASGRIGVTSVKREPADGYALLWGTPSSMTLPTAVDDNLPFDPVRDFNPVVQLFSSTYFLVVNSKLPVRSLPELVDYARAHPNKLSYGTWGLGSAPHLLGLMFATAAKIDIVQVPYRGEGALTLDLNAGRLDMAFMIEAKPHIDAGFIRALGTSSPEPWFTLPDAPPIGQFLPGVRMLGWMGLCVPAGTPAPIVAKLNSLVNQALKTESMRSFMQRTGHVPVGGEPDVLARTIDEDIRTIRKVVADAHLTFGK